MTNSYPPLGLAYLAAVMESDGHELAIFDLGLDPDTPPDKHVDSIAAFEPDLVGMTAMTNNYHSAQGILALLKNRIGCPTVLGGPHATVFPELLVKDDAIDYVVYGEGEETLRELVQALWEEGGQPSARRLRAIEGLCFLAESEPCCNPPRPLIRDLDALPMPARHLLDLQRYSLAAPSGEPMVTVLSSRGCPYNCSYCFKGIVGRTYRQQSPESILAEIRHLIEDYGYHSFYFIDDLFTLDQRRLRSVAEQIVIENLDIRWQCLARVDRVTPDILRLMHQSGCRELHYGIESGNAEILAGLGKGITLDQVRNAVRWTAEAGILAKGYFMLGLPGDNEETMEQTIRLASELDLDQAMFSLTTPFPGTRLWDELTAQQPEIVFSQEFASAYYYVDYDHMIEPFFNLSQVSDERLAQLASEAQPRFQESKRRRKYTNALGPVVGTCLYQASNVRLLRDIGHKALRTDLARRLRGPGDVGGLGRLGEYDQKRELAKKWD